MKSSRDDRKTQLGQGCPSAAFDVWIEGLQSETLSDRENGSHERRNMEVVVGGM
jgi:hypothetical protein